MACALWYTSPNGRRAPLIDRGSTWLFVILFVMLLRGAVASSYFQPNRSEDSYGRQFHIVLPVENNTRIRMIHNLLISSRSRNTVRVKLSRPGSSWPGKSVSIQAHIGGNITLDMNGPIRHPYNPNGIAVQLDAEDAVSVWVSPGRGDFILDGYRAIPREALGRNYASVLYPGAGGYTSEIVLFSPSDSSNQIFMSHVRSNLTVTIDNSTSVLPLFISLPKMDSAKIVSSSDLSGLDFTAEEPISVVSTRMCRPTSTTGSASQSCSSLMEEVTPLGVWGRSFVILPQVPPAPAKMKLRLVGGLNETVVSILRPSGMVYQTQTLMANESLVKDIEITTGVPLTLRSNKPISVTQFFTSGRKRLDYGAMLNVPPVEQFTNQTVVFPALNHTLFKNVLILITRCEHRRDVILDGEDISGQYQYSVIFNQDVNHTVHGTYCTLNKTLKVGWHTLQLRKDANVGTAYSAVLYGSAVDQAYAYPVAADMREIACDVKYLDIVLCDYYVPPDYIAPSSTTVSPGTSAPKASSAPDHRVAIIVVLVVLSSLAALIVVVIAIGRCGRTKDGARVTWSRLPNTSDIQYDVSIDNDDDVPMDSV